MAGSTQSSTHDVGERSESNQTVKRGENGGTAQQDAANSGAGLAGRPATRKELESYIEGFKSSDTWHFGERVPGELVGTWRTINRRDAPIVFRDDGSYSQEFNGNMSEGLYAISDSGKVVAYSKWNGIGLGAHYRLQGQILIGPHGAIPNERWERAANALNDSR